MALVLGCQLMTGTGFFCAREILRPLRVIGIDPLALRVTASHDRGEVSGMPLGTAEGQGGNSNCCCKKHKCPTIPRAAITSDPTGGRFSEFQRQSKSARCDTLIPHLTSHCVAARGTPLLIDLGSSARFYSPAPLGLTCVLLI